MFREGLVAPGGSVGDTYMTNEWVDKFLVTWDGWLGRAAKLYANGHDFKDTH